MQSSTVSEGLGPEGSATCMIRCSIPGFDPKQAPVYGGESTTEKVTTASSCTQSYRHTTNSGRWSSGRRLVLWVHATEVRILVGPLCRAWGLATLLTCYVSSNDGLSVRLRGTACRDDRVAMCPPRERDGEFTQHPSSVRIRLPAYSNPVSRSPRSANGASRNVWLRFESGSRRPDGCVVQRQDTRRQSERRLFESVRTHCRGSQVANGSGLKTRG
jgi:hypothetical protein